MKYYYIVTDSNVEKEQAFKALTAVGYVPKPLSRYSPSDYRYLFIAGKSIQVARQRPSGFRQTTVGELINQSLELTKKAVCYPPPSKYKVRYTKDNGETNDYVISNPVEEDGKKITAYCFGRGIRSFVKERINSFEKV